jgi:hypothetical protein
MTRVEVLQGLFKLKLRERLIWKLAVFGGLRPGEIFALPSLPTHRLSPRL